MPFKMVDSAFFLLLLVACIVKPTKEYIALFFLVGIITALLPRRWWSAFFLVAVPSALLVGYPLEQQPTGRPMPWPQRRLSNLWQAIWSYQADHGSFPPRFIRDKHGNAGLSWRVLLLPYLGYPELYAEFDITEPWDSPRNLNAARKIPREYTIEQRTQQSRMSTDVMVVYGPSCFWRDEKPIEPKSISGRHQSLIFFVSVPNPKQHFWSSPIDLAVSEFNAYIESKPKTDWIWCCYANGACEPISNQLDLVNWQKGFGVSDGPMDQVEVDSVNEQTHSQLSPKETESIFASLMSREALLLYLTLVVVVSTNVSQNLLTERMLQEEITLNQPNP